MMPNITRGAQMHGLMSYLFGPGRDNVHENGRVVGGTDDIFLMYGGRSLSDSEVTELAREMELAQRMTGTLVEVKRARRDSAGTVLLEEKVPANVWHCSLSLREGDKRLTDEQWREIASEFVDAMGFTESSGKEPCTWVAVNHGVSKAGNEHIHIAVQLVRRDGTKASTHNDFQRAQNVARLLEVKYGLDITGDRSAGLGTRGVTPAAREASARRGAVEPDAIRLARTVRAAATSAADEAEFVRRCRRNGLLVRPRFAEGRNDVVQGYSVALRPLHGEQIVWHGGGKLARDLTLPRLRAEWEDTAELAGEAIDEWRAAYHGERPVKVGREADEPDPELWKQYTAEVGKLHTQLQSVPMGDTATWAIVARETAGVFAAWSQRVEATPGPLAAVSDELAKSAQIRAHQVQPRPSKMVSIGGAALLASGTMHRGSNAAQMMLLVRQLASTSEALHDVLEARGAARRAEQMASVVKDKLQEVHKQLAGEARAAGAVPRHGVPPSTRPNIAVTRNPNLPEAGTGNTVER